MMESPAISPLWIIAAIALVVLGVIVLWIGIRGRRMDDHPICRRCGFDLFGLPESSQLCSECGADLKRHRAIRIGHRQKRKGIISAAVVLILIGSMGTGLTGWMMSKGIDVNQYKPVW